MIPICIFIGRSIQAFVRLLGTNGASLPGLVIEKLYPPFLNKTLSRLPRGVIVVTGTNGKTTTTKAMADLLEAHGLRVLTNKTGSNFVRGIISIIINKAKFSGKLPYDIAVFEQDEAHAVHFVRRIRPRGVIALNIMRDQMDRFGEINTTARLVGKTTAAATEWVVLNANDPLISGLSADVTAPHTYWFGHSEKLMPQFLTDDQMHRLEAPTYFVAAEPDACLLDISGNSIRVNVNGTEASFDLKLDGSHNAINLAAVLAALEAVLPDASTEVTKQAIEAIEPAFGRGERITLNNGATLRLQLVKNPGGFTHALSLLDTQDYDAIGIAINDDYADGRDMSWLWDVDFEAVRPLSSKVICGGTRGHDMAVRLKYDDVSTTNIATDNTKFLELLTAQMQTDAIIFCTYTSMLQLRSLLKKYSSELERVEL